MKIQVWMASETVTSGLLLWAQTGKPRDLWPQFVEEAAANHWRIVHFDRYFDLYRIKIEPMKGEAQ